MNDTNINCRHKQLIRDNTIEINFCKNCGCFLILKYGSSQQKEVESFSVIPNKMITPLDVSPFETFTYIHRNLKKANLDKDYEKLPKEYLNIRKILINLLKDYIIEYNFSTRSYFLGIYILDFIHCKYDFKKYIEKLKLDLLVLGVFLVAVKFIDDDAYPPCLDSFPNKKNPTIYYSLNEVRKYEVIVATLMEFQLDHYTSYYLTETILNHGIVFTSELQQMDIKDGRSIKNKLKKLYRLSLDINKMFVEDPQSIKFCNLTIAATSVVMAKELLKFDKTWNKELELLYKIKHENLTSCYNSILK